MKPALQSSISLRILGAVLTLQLGKVIDRTAGRVLQLGGVAVAMLALGGGLGAHAAEGEALVHTPAFSIQKQEEAFWLVSPQGNRFFSLGVCCANQGVSRGEFDPANPGYGAWQHYAGSSQWANATQRRLKAWGFTTVGGWSDLEALRACREVGMAFAPVLHIGSTAGAPWWDMWDPRVVQRMDDVAREQILPWCDDPRLIGYDEPTHGRFDGENFSFGLVDIHDLPYEALTATAASLDLVGLKGRTGRPRADADQGIPPAPRNPLEGFAPGLALQRWDRERGFVQPVSEFPLADLYVCWNSKAVYLGQSWRPRY